VELPGAVCLNERFHSVLSQLQGLGKPVDYLGNLGAVRILMNSIMDWTELFSMNVSSSQAPATSTSSYYLKLQRFLSGCTIFMLIYRTSVCMKSIYRSRNIFPQFYIEWC